MPGGAGGRPGSQKARAPPPTWGQVSGLTAPAFASLWFPGPAGRGSEGQPQPVQPVPRGLGPKHSIPNPRVSSFPERTSPRRPRPGTWEGRSSPCLGRGQQAGRPVGHPVPEDSRAGLPLPGPPAPHLSRGPASTPGCTPASCAPNSGKVTEAASVGFRKAGVRARLRRSAGASRPPGPPAPPPPGPPPPGGLAPLCQLGHGGGRPPSPGQRLGGQAAARQECLPTSHPCVDLTPQPFSAHPTPAGRAS